MESGPDDEMTFGQRLWGWEEGTKQTLGRDIPERGSTPRPEGGKDVFGIIEGKHRKVAGEQGAEKREG